MNPTDIRYGNRRGGSSSGGPAVFDPATLALSGWWREYPGASPWTPTASAGGSGSNGDLAGASPPAAGTSLNGHATASLDGVTQRLLGGSCTTFFTSGAGSLSLLFKPDATVVPASAGYDEPGVWGGTGGAPGVSLTTSGFGFILYDTGYKVAYVAAATGSYCSVQMKWDGSNMRYRANSSAWANLATGSVDFSGGVILLGSNFNGSARAPGTAAEVALANVTLSDSDMDNLKSYYNGRYGLSL